MEFAILGPVRVVGASAPVKAPMLRALLALLTTRPNRAVPVDVLVDALWGDQLDTAAPARLQLLVHRLRRALGEAERIRFEYGGYSLRVDPGELDAERFESLRCQGAAAAAAGETAPAVRMLRQALELWQGDPFADVGELRGRSSVLQVEAERLAECRLTTYETLFELELEHGQQRDVLAELGAIARQHPLRERLAVLTMRALYLEGRQGDALDVYQQARRALIGDLGLEPGPELRALEQSILAGEDLTSPARRRLAPKPAQVPGDIGDFTGRAAQVELLVGHLGPTPADAGTTSRGVVVIAAIAGAAGVGKTTLAVHAAHRLRDHYPDGQLYVNLRGARDEPLDPGEALARFLRALGMEAPTIPEALDERTGLYRSLLSGRRALVLLDDAAGAAQVRPLLPGTPECAVLVTSRSRLSGLEGARPVDLDVFDPEQAVELLARITGERRVAAEPAAATEIARLCGHLPLAVRVAGSRLAARPHWPLARLAERLTDEHGRLGELCLGDLEVRASLALSYDGLGATSRRALRCLGLLPSPDFAGWAAAAALDTSLAEAESALEDLVDARMLETVGHDGTGQQRYRLHDLIRVFARERCRAEDTEPDPTAALERYFGALVGLAQLALQRVGETHLTVASGLPRWHLPSRVVDSLLVDPLAWFDAEQASLWSAAEHTSASTGMHVFAWELAAALRYFQDRGHPGDWRHIHELALAAVRDAGDRRGEGVTLLSLGSLHYVQDRCDQAVQCFEDAAVALGDVGERLAEARAECNLGDVYRHMGRLGPARRSVARALRTFVDLGDRLLEARARYVQGLLEADEGNLHDASNCFTQAHAGFNEVGFRRGEAWTLEQLGTLHRRLGRLDEAVVCLEQCCNVTDQIGHRHENAYASHELAAAYIDQGRRRDAEALLPRCLAAARELGDRHLEALTLRSLGELHKARSRFEDAVACVDQARAIWHEIGLPLWRARALRTLGEVLVAAGDEHAAERALAEAVDTFRDLGSPEADEVATSLDR